MNEQNIISLGYDIEKMSTQQKQIVGWLTEMLALAEKLDGVKLSFAGVEGMKDYNKAAKDQKSVMDEVAKAEEKLTQLRTDEAKRLAELKEQIRQTNQENKVAAQVANSQADSLEQLRAKLIQAQKAYDSMGKQMRENSQEGKDAKAKVDSLTASIKGLEEGTGRFGRNVGNYAGALKSSFDQLNSQLEGVKAKLSSMKETDTGFAKVSADAEFLEKIVNGLNSATTGLGGSVNTTSGSFKNGIAELKAFEKAGAELGARFGVTSDEFIKFTEDIAERKDAIADAKAAIKFQSSDTKYLDGVVSAISGITGAYGAWQAATALIGDDNEELAKSMAKLQAIMTLVTSVQAVANSLQSESGAIQTVVATKTWLLNTALEAQALITAEGTAATYGLSTALISTGIGALVIALGVGVFKLIGAISDMVGANEKAIKTTGELADVNKQLNDILKAQADLMKSASQISIEAYEKELEAAKSSGANQEKQFAIQEKINSAKLEQANQLVAKLGVTESAVVELSLKYGENNDYLSSLIEQERKYLEQGKKVPDDLKNKIDAQSKLTDFSKATYELNKGALDDQKKQIAVNENEKLAKAKFNADELRRLTLETAKLNANDIINANAIVLGNEYSTQEQRLEAMRKTASAQRSIAIAENKAIQDDPSVSSTSKELAAKNLASNLKNIKRSSAEEQRKLNDDYRKRDETAVANTNRAILDNEIKTKQEIASSDTFSLEVRLEALKQYSDDQRKNVLADAALQKSTKVMTPKELAELDSKTQIQLSTITADGELKRVDIIKSSFDKLKALNAEHIADIDALNVDNQSKAAVQYSADIIALNKQLEGKTVSLRKYARLRDEIDYKYSLDQAAMAINQVKDQAKVLESFLKNGSTIEELEKHKSDVIAQISADTNDIEKRQHEAELKRTEDELNAKKDAQKQINKLVEDGANAEKAASDAKKEHDTKLKEVKLKELQDTIQKVQETANEVTSIIGNILDIQFTEQKNHIQDIENSQQESYSAEIERINSSSLTEQEKADKLKILEAQRQAQKEKNARDQKKIDLDKAKFDKDVSIMNIVLTTAMAVVKALPNIPLAVLAGAMGAAQLAVAIATPLPKYAKGTDGVVNPHFGIYGEAGPELIHKPGQSPFIADKATVDFLPVGTKITPLSNMELFAAAERKQSMNLQAAAYADSLNSRAYADMMRAQSKAITSSIDGQTSALVAAITKSRPVVKVVNSGNYDSFINKNVR